MFIYKRFGQVWFRQGESGVDPLQTTRVGRDKHRCRSQDPGSEPDPNKVIGMPEIIRFPHDDGRTMAIRPAG